MLETSVPAVLDRGMTDNAVVAAAVPTAAGELVDVLGRVTAADRPRPTPCTDFSVADLLEHLHIWTPRLVDASGTRTSGAADLAAEVAVLGQAWSDPATWEGSGSVAGSELPRSVVGRMVLVELVMHGWDLSAALSGDGTTWTSSVADVAADVLAGMAEQGRRMGAFGPEVEVSPSAPIMHRALALAGRDPAWRP
ncbi:uncharacterized protein (TIGR03086 family) [Prauserella rugosa]|uniref:Uncharacterized protein (TIGR03086 family) n=2 Tax=Prauserella rugosa TaxID=43354 RepID=A0A660CJ59_9PSEU|nr:TIGR03086 family protein [Prauserella sp. Am3]TWH21141.1 uncharacterized protein (TIGR03086 family) [Prauserella rugosa]